MRSIRLITASTDTQRLVFRAPSQLREAHQQQGLLVDYEEIIPPPLNGLRIEGTFRRQPDNLEMRRTVVYVPDMARERFALLSLQAYAADWEIVKPELLEVVQSLRLEGIRMSANMTRTPPGGQAQGYPAGAAGTASATERSSNWGQLEVAGSLLLAALLIGSLILSGRATP